jgi:FO synthase
MEETISRMAGSTNGSSRDRDELEAIATAAGRPSRQRTSLYGEVGTTDRTLDIEVAS